MAARSHALPGVGLGDHAAADPRRERHPLLRALHGALSERAGAGAGAHRRGAAPLVGARLLRPRTQPASHRATAVRMPRRRVSRVTGCDCCPARYRAFHRRGRARTLARPPACHPRRQRQTRAGPGVRRPRLARSSASRAQIMGNRRCTATRGAHCRVHPGNDGPGCNRLYARHACLSELSNAGPLRRRARRAPGGISHSQAEARAPGAEHYPADARLRTRRAAAAPPTRRHLGRAVEPARAAAG